MCGICGFIGNPERVNTSAMLGALSHRGPDDTGQFRQETEDGVLWLGHKRLAIIDITPGGHQPMIYGKGRFAITFNGEVYNFREVREELESADIRFSSGSDTEVILAAWQKWGQECLSRLVGMFAFALWDAEEQSLWLARDRLGEKPLYYTEQPGRFLFASEVRSLLASGVVERRVDRDGLDSYLSFGSVCQPYTLVEGVRSLDAGSVLVLRKGRVRSRAYWSLADIEERNPADPPREQLSAVLDESLRQSMVSDVPVGVLLSGGVDSTATVALLRRQGFDCLSTFTVVFDDHPAFNEDQRAREVADHFGTDHHRIPVTMEEARESMVKAVESMDQPSTDGPQTFIVSRAIARTGLKVALSGLGSDELFFGYGLRRHYKSLLTLARIRPLSVPLSLFAGLSAGGSLAGRFVPALARVRKLTDLYVEGSREAAAYLTWQSVFSHGEIDRLRASRRPSPSRFVRISGGDGALSALSCLDLNNYMKNTLLANADQMSMANSLELRAPFLDYRLVELVTSLPLGLRLASGRYKELLVDAVADPLVTETAGRPKSGFELPLESWLRDGLRLGSLRPDLLGMDEKEVAGVERRFRLGEKYTRYWSLLVLSRWLEKMGMSPCGS